MLQPNTNTNSNPGTGAPKPTGQEAPVKQKTMEARPVNSLAQTDVTQEMSEQEKALVVNSQTQTEPFGTPTVNYTPGQFQQHSTFIVPAAWGLHKIADHLGVSIEALKEANNDKIKTWGTVEGFEAGEVITVPPQNIQEEVRDELPQEEAVVEKAPQAEVAASAESTSKVMPASNAPIVANEETSHENVNVTANTPPTTTNTSKIVSSKAEVNTNKSLKVAEANKLPLNPDTNYVWTDLVVEAPETFIKSKGTTPEEKKAKEISDAKKDKTKLRDTFKNGISGSVGKNGVNFYLDVISVAIALEKHGYTLPEKAKTEGLCSTEFIELIKSYQKDKMGKENPDGRVDAVGGGKTASKSITVGGTWNHMNSAAGTYNSGLTNIYGDDQDDLTKRLKSSTSVLKGDVGADTKNNKAENNKEDVIKVAAALTSFEISVPETASKEGTSSKEFIAAIKKFQTKKKCKTIDGNITKGYGTEKLLFPEATKKYKIDKLRRTKLGGGKYKFKSDNLQERGHYMETVDKLGETIGLNKGSKEAEVVAMAEKAATKQDYYNELTKDVPFEVKYFRKKAGDNVLNPVLEKRLAKFHKFLVAAGYYRGNMSVGDNGAVRDSSVGHKWAVEHYIVTNRTTATIKQNLIKMYNDSSLTTADSSLLLDQDGFDWAEKSYFTIKAGVATDVDMGKVKSYVNLKGYRSNKTSSAAEGYKQGNTKRYPLSLNGYPNQSNHVEGNAIDISSKLFINRNEAIIDLIALKFGVFRCAGGEQWHFEATDVAIDQAEIEQHLSGGEIKGDRSLENTSSTGSSEFAVPTPNNEQSITKVDQNEVVKPEVKEKISDPKVSTQKPSTFISQTQINQSVGEGGANKPEDVRFIALNLQRLGFATGFPAIVLGKCDATLINAIKIFQQKHFKFTPDGLITSGKDTEKKILALLKLRMQSKEPELTPTELIKKYEDNLVDLGKHLARKIQQNPKLVAETISEIGWLNADNLSVAICENLSATQLQSVDKLLVQTMYDEIWDFSIAATYFMWLTNPALATGLSASNLSDFKQISKLKKVLNGSTNKSDNKKGGKDEESEQSKNEKSWDSEKCFEEEFLPTLFKHEGGYQAKESDSGNWVDGKLIGTNHGVSAPVLKSHLKRDITVDDMKKLTKKEAGDIYKSLYWDKPMVGQINDKYVAIQYADIYVNGGGSSVKIMQRALNNLGFKVSVDGGIGTETITAINKADAKKLHDEFKKERIKYYESLYNKNPEKYGEWINGWKKRANSFSYGED